MSVDVYFGLTAVDQRRAVPRATRCHVHLTAKPFVVVGYHMPGDSGAPIGLLCGTRRERPSTIVVGEPREARLRFAQLASFAMDLNGYAAQFMQAATTGRRARHGQSGLAAPQLVVPNQATAQWLCDLMGRRLRYLRPDGDWPVHPGLPVAGAHLSFFAGQRVPGSSLVLPLTEVLAQHWATGQLASLDTDLASQLAWIADPSTLDDADQALPAGPVPDPDWETRELSDAIKGYHQLIDVHPQQADQPMIRTINDALRPAWDDCWQALDLLRTLPPAHRVNDRWGEDVYQWSRHAERVRSGQAYFRKRPKQLQVFRYLTRLERLTADLHRDMALDDPLIMASHVAAGEALSGEVVAVDVAGRRPTVQVRPDLPFPRPVGTDLFWHLPSNPGPNGPTRPVVRLTVTTAAPDELVTLDVTAGAVRRDRHSRLPQPGQHVVFSPFGPRDYHPDTLPAELPWTHAEDEDDE